MLQRGRRRGKQKRGKRCGGWRWSKMIEIRAEKRKREGGQDRESEERKEMRRLEMKE